MTTVTKMNVIPVSQSASENTTSTVTASTTTTTKLTKNGNLSWPWFHGKITRDEAERLLKPSDSTDGLFLVRESTNFPGDYTLCVCFQNKVEHYRVIVRDNLLTIDEEEHFETLGHLIGEKNYCTAECTIFREINIAQQCRVHC